MIKPYNKNAKKHPDKQLKLIAKSLKEFGCRQPIVVDKDDVIIVGHGRWLAYQKFKDEYNLTEPKIERADDLTPKQVKAYRLADNKLNESDWDMDLAIEDLKDLDDNLFELTGFDADLLLEPDEKDDEVPDNAPPVAKLGDVWALGRHRVMCGDSTKVEDVEKLMDGKKADMVFTDPPYNIAYEGGSKKREMIENDKVDDFYKFLLDAYTNYFINMKSGASIYVCHADTERVNFTKAFNDAGFKLSSVIIWIKDNATFGRQDYFWRHEPILYGWNKNGAHSWYGDHKQDTFWNVKRPSRSDAHPTMKPIELVSKALANSSKSDDIVMDLFLGSGSTLIACEKTNRICYGCELDEKYIDVIITRYCEYTGNYNIIRNGEPIVWQKKENA